MAPPHCENPPLSSKPAITLSRSSPVGMVIYLGPSTQDIVLQVDYIMLLTVEQPTPKRWLNVLYSILVASLHKFIATRLETGAGSRTCSLLSNVWFQFLVYMLKLLFRNTHVF